MKGSLLKLHSIVCFFALLVVADESKGANYVWNGAGVAGGTGGTAFNTAANWKVGGVVPGSGPGVADNVSMTVNANANIQVNITSNTTIASLTVSLTGGNNGDYWALFANGANLTITGATTLTCTGTPGFGTDYLLIGQTNGTTITYGGAVTCTGDYVNNNRESLVYPLLENDNGNGIVYIDADFTANNATATPSGFLPRTVYFDAIGTQTIYVNNPYYYIYFPNVQIGKNNTPTVVFNSNNEEDVYLVNGNCTISSNCTVILQQGNGFSTGGELDANNTGTFTMDAGSTLEVQDNTDNGNYANGTNNNFPGSYSAYFLNVNSTVIYNPTTAGTAQDVYNTPTYGNLTITDASGAGTCVTSARGTTTVAGNMLISPNSTYNGSNRTTNVAGDWTNNGTFTYSTSTINFNGTSNQTLTGATQFYNLTFNNTNTTTYIGETFANDMTVRHTLTFSATNKGLTNLNGYSLIVGVSGAVAGSIAYPNSGGSTASIAGWAYGGTFTRWINSGSTIALPAAGSISTAGFFPVGSAPGGGNGALGGNFEPFWFATSSNVTTANTLSVTQGSTVNYYTSITSYLDASWNKTVVAVSKANWTLANGGITLNTANTGEVMFGGDAFQTFVDADVNASNATSTVATYVAPSNFYGAAVDLEVERTGLTMAQAAATWYIGTINTSLSPLPVNLTSFTADCDNYYAILHWTTASESNNSYFTLERTQDGDNYETVATVKGAGTTSSTTNYTAVDNNPLLGNSYYRLSQTDMDGTMRHIGTVVFTPCENEETINAFASSGKTINIQINTLNQASYQVNLVNDMGQVVYSTSKNTSIGLNEYKLQTQVANGIYFLQIIGNNKVYTRKLVLGGY